VPGAALGTVPGVEHGVVDVAVQGACVPGALAFEDPAAPGVAAVPGEVEPGVLSFTVPGEVGGGVVGVAVEGAEGVDCPGVVVCGEVLMPLVLVLPLAPGLATPGCAL